MNKWNRSIPEGMRDYVFKDVRRRREIENGLLRLFESRGYSEVITPVLEFYDVFCTDGGNNIPQEDLYKLFDAKGRILTLRHDMTTPIARVAATKLRDAVYPLKLYYIQNVFRSNDHLNGKRDEVTQCGIEIIGAGGQRADIEAIITAIESMRSLGVDNFQIELSHIGYFKEVAKQLPDCNEGLAEQIRSWVEMKNFAALSGALDKLDPKDKAVIAMRKLPRLFGAPSIIEEGLALAPCDSAKQPLHYLMKICRAIESLGYGEHISIDLGMVHHIGYYTGLVFKGYIAGSGDSCLAGGRYDGLLEQFGGKLPSVGFAISVDSILDTMYRHNCLKDVKSAPDLVICYDEGFLPQAEMAFLRFTSEGMHCDISLISSVEESKNYAKKRGTKQLCHIGEKGSEMITLDREEKK